MGNWWKITRLEVILGLKDRQAFIWALLVPLLLTAFIGYSFGGGGEPGPVRANLQAGKNPPYVEKIFRTLLKKENITISNASRIPMISLPDSLIQNVLSGEGATIDVKVKEESSSARVVAAAAQKILFTIFFNAREEWLEKPPSDEEIERLFQKAGPLKLSSSKLGRSPRIPGNTERTLPPTIIMFLLFSLFTFFAALWVEDTKTGKIRRITLSPTSIRSILLAQIFSRILWGILQVTVVGVIGTILFKIKWELPVASTAILLLSYMFAITSLGLLFGSLFDNAEKAHVLGVVLSLVLAAVGGCWWPLEIVPKPMKIAALFTPTGMAMDAVGNFLADGKYASFPAFNVLLLMGMGVIVMPLAIHRMKKQIIK